MQILATRSILGILLFLCAAPLAFSQTAQITGQISDPSGASVPGAAVTVTNVATRVSAHGTANGDGYYTAPFLAPGDYSIAVTKEGFKTAGRSDIHLDVSQIARIDIQLALGSQSEKVEVTASGPLVQSESTTVGQVIGDKTVLDLPLNGRNFTQLTTLAPGTSTGAPVSPFVHGITVLANGMRSSNTMFMVNGVNTTDMDYEGTPFFPPPDAIQEFKLQTNDLDSSVGLGGAVVSVELKGGTNALHGSLYEYLRNDALDARNFFSNSVPTLKQNQFGFTLGAPIRKDKTFFFVDYQGTRNHAGQTFNDVVPTSAMQAGNFTGLKAINDPTTGKPFPNNLIPADRISPQSAFFLKFFPLPNTPQGTFVYTGTNTSDADQFDVRIDHQFREADSLKVTYSFIQPNLFTPGPFPSNGAATTALRHQAAGVSETHTFSPNVVNQATAGYARIRSFGTQQGLGANYTVQSGIGGLDVTSADFPGFPALTPSGYTGLTNNAFQPLNFRENNYNLRDLATFAHGKHFIQAGVELTLHANVTTNAAHNRGEFTFSGTYTGNGWGDYLLGIPSQGSRGFPRDLFGYGSTQLEPFVQDTWKITPRLTMIAGLRYSWYPQPRLLHNVVSSTDPVANRIVVGSDSQGHVQVNAQQLAQYVFPLFADIIVPSSKVGLDASLRQPEYKNFGPRLGVAWQPGRGFVIRTGYAIVYSRYQGGVIESSSLPFFADQTGVVNTTPTPSRTLANFFPPIVIGNFTLPPLTFLQMDPHSPYPYFQQWNFAVQKVIGGVVSAEGAYVGSKGTHLAWGQSLNVPPPGPGDVQARRQNPRFAAGSLLEENDNTSYNSFQGKLETRAWKGLTTLGTFTWSKALDYALNVDAHAFTMQDPNNMKAERGPYGPAERFTLSAVYELPFLKKRSDFLGRAFGGWELTSIVTSQSGLPFTPTINTDPANTGTSKRPNRIASGTLPNPAINQWFDVGAFKAPAQFTYGNSGVNILTGPGSTNWDSGLFKNFRFRRAESAYLQFRAEFFNFTNTPHFGLPTASIQSPTAGKILSAGTPRQIQFALKLAF